MHIDKGEPLYEALKAAGARVRMVVQEGGECAIMGTITMPQFGCAWAHVVLLPNPDTDPEVALDFNCEPIPGLPDHWVIT